MGHFFEGDLDQGGRRLCNFSQIVVRYDWVFCNISTCQLFRSLRKMLPLLKNYTIGNPFSQCRPAAHGWLDCRQ